MTNVDKCKCKQCPSYTKECMVQTMAHMPSAAELPKMNHFEGLFCAFGKSTCFDKETGCVCGDCDVHSENKLKGGYYCTRGN
ncbi:MAG: DUF2769 domain-containing protein [Spirochaetaceae bacterium]|nr:DUF2769 domain-containing protein [Spirochaetaceae bacterium]